MNNNQQQQLGFFPYFISLFPGLGHMYLQRYASAFAYGFLFWGTVILFFITLTSSGHSDLIGFLFFGDIILWIVCFIDMMFSLQKRKWTHWGVTPQGIAAESDSHYNTASNNIAVSNDPQEQSKITVLSIIPGLAHYHLGLMQRGLTTMVLFFGAPIFILFIASISRQSGFALFLLALPILWFYSLFDALNIYKRKLAGETIEDHSFFEDFYKNRSGNRKNRTVATLLSIFPGAGHMYLGLQNRGIQLMVGFILSLYLLDIMRLSLFLLLIPVWWFFAFFDALQHISKIENESLEDVPVIKGLVSYQRWIGFGMLVLGIYYVIDQVSPRLYYQLFEERYPYYWIKEYLNIAVVTGILVVGGIVLLIRKKKS